MEVLQLKDEYKALIVKWRKVVNKYSGRSTVDHDYLQNAVKAWQKEKVNYICTIHHTLVWWVVQCYILHTINFL